jgi:sugar/nucleoside kinase (ribokinase family)
MRILVAGELNPDLILRNYQSFPAPGKEVLVEDLHLTLGSSSAICAVGLARLGNRVAFAANVGSDMYGDFCLAALDREGIDVTRVNRRADLKTGVTVSITSSADRALVTYPGAIASLQAEDLPDSVFPGFAHFHVSSYFLQGALRRGLKGLFGRARRMGLSTSLDPGYDPSEQWSPELIDTLQEVDVFLPNETEIRGITGCKDVHEGVRLLDNGHTLVAAKLGPEGAISFCRGTSFRAGAFPTEVVDTTGAGDSFDAGFLHAWLRRRPLQDCLHFASACGALSVRGLGGTTAQPAEEEVETFLRARAGAAGRRTQNLNFTDN